MGKLNKEVIRLIDRLYKDLYLSKQVIHHGIGNKYDKFNNIESYINKLENIHEKASKEERYIEYLKKLYYDKYVIKKEDIPESYYKHQQEIALERGYGYVEITEIQKQELQEEVINNQKASIDTWLNYFLSEDAKVYPFWAKYWAFQGMLKLGTYDKEKQIFNKRDKNTVAPFADLNREALAMSIDLMIKILNKEEIFDKELENLVKTGSFQKIYSHIITNTLKDNKNITKRNIGRWVKYDQGSDHMPLVNSLKGYNTGWCTAGESTAKSQLQYGDFYVYYTLDENNEYKVPRIAIRMEYGKIGEIRGIAKDQNMEPEMEEVLEEKIKDFPDKEQYYKKVNDMKQLTLIHKKQNNNQELTKEELMFLYETEEEIRGFGYEKDPRIEELINKRNLRKDLAFVFNCSEEQIATTPQELKNKKIVYYYGNLYLRWLENIRDLVLPKHISGCLDLSGLTSAEGLVLPQSIGENLDLSGLKSAEGLEFPQTVGSLYLDGLTSAKGLVLPQKIKGTLNLSSLTSAEDLKLPQIIGGHLDLSSITSAKGLVLPKILTGGLDLYSLTSVENLVLPQTIGSLYLNSITNAKGLVLPQEIGGNLDLSGLKSAEGLVLPQKIGESLDLSNLTSSEGLVLPQTIGWNLFLDRVTSAEGLVLPQKIEGTLYLSSLTSTEGLIIPEPLTYNIIMNGFEITPENVDQYRNSKKI